MAPASLDAFLREQDLEIYRGAFDEIPEVDEDCFFSDFGSKPSADRVS